MDKDIDKNVPPEQAELMSLVELQKFIADELSNMESQSEVKRSFRPLTDGLGFYPEKKQAPVFDKKKISEVKRLADAFGTEEPAKTEFSAQNPSAEAWEEPASEEKEAKPSLSDLMEPPPKAGEPRFKLKEDKLKEDADLQTKRSVKKREPQEFKSPSAPKQEASKLEQALQVEPKPSVAVPPPVPRPTLMRRIFAGFVDQCVVLSIWSMAVVITFQALSTSGMLSAEQIMMEVSTPLVARFVIMEFAVIWLGYLVVGLGLLDSTVGMWIWGMRVSYSYTGIGKAVAKLLRVLLSFMIVAPIVPSFLLLIQKRGRNLIDGMTGSQIYRTVV